MPRVTQQVNVGKGKPPAYAPGDRGRAVGRPGAILGLARGGTFIQEPTCTDEPEDRRRRSNPGLSSCGRPLSLQGHRKELVSLPGARNHRRGAQPGAKPSAKRVLLCCHHPISCSCPWLNGARSQWASWQWHLGNVVCRRSGKGSKIRPGPHLP